MRPERRRGVEHRGEAGAHHGLAGKDQREGDDVVEDAEQQEAAGQCGRARREGGPRTAR